MAKANARLELSPEQEPEAQRLEAILRSATDADIREMPRLMASKKDHKLFGQTEF